MNCSQCYQPLREGAQFCDNCGALTTHGRDSLAASTPTTGHAGADSNAASSDPLVGRVIDSRYELIERLSAGDMGAVYRARHVYLRVELAIKVLRPEFVTDSAAVERFRSEALAAASLRHPNVVAITDYGKSRGPEGFAYIVMELVGGVSLRELLKEAGKLAPPRAVALMLDICAGVGAAHRQGIEHGGLKPDNIIVLAPAADHERETIKVVDFGITKLRALASENALTQTGMILGTPSYMSPEQCRGEASDARADVYSLAAMLYEMLAGTPPFTASTITSVIAKHLTEAPPPLSTHVAGIPRELESLLMRALAKDPDARPQDATVFASELQAAVASLPAGDEKKQLVYDENVQFTVYRPKTIKPSEWNDLLAFAYLSERPLDAQPDAPDPLEEVKKQAQQILCEQAAEHQDVTEDSNQAVPREGEITFLPEVPGIEFRPPRRSFMWEGDVHCEKFRLRASPTLDGRVTRGRVSVFLGSILLADINISIRVDSAYHRDTRTPPAEESNAARPYRKIFASYSRRDIEIVKQFEHLADALGDEYLRDLTHLRAGQEWNEGLKGLIRQADIFQLFWSRNSMTSPFVRQEWEYALSLGRPNFIRPTYWEEPLPSAPEKNLPPEELARLHFQRIHAVSRDAQRDTSAALNVFWSKSERAARAPTSTDESYATTIVVPREMHPPPAPPSIPPPASMERPFSDPMTTTAATVPAAAPPTAYGAPPVRARLARAPLYAGLMTAVVAVFLVGVFMTIQLGSRSVENANTNINVNTPATNANIAREEYERDKARYEREAREAGRTIGQGANDPWLWTKTRAALLAADDLRDSAIDVDVENDVVTLSGTVASQSQKTRAGEIAQHTEGVRGVRNNLTVSADGDTNINTNANRNANAHRNANPKS